MNAPHLSSAQCQAIDRRAIDEYGMSSLVLMENAGRATVDVLERLGINGPLVILCGKGNNAGDGFVIARHLAIRGYEPRVALLTHEGELRGDAATNFAILKKCKIPCVEISPQRAGSSSTPTALQFNEALDQTSANADWIIDAMLGTGAMGDPRAPFDAAIDWMNSQPCKKLAVDIPSGLDCDTGAASSQTVLADHTCTYAAMKIGFTLRDAARYTGTIHLCDIGVPPRLIDEIAHELQLRKQ